jgi:hypothetical protein
MCFWAVFENCDAFDVGRSLFFFWLLCCKGLMVNPRWDWYQAREDNPAGTRDCSVKLSNIRNLEGGRESKGFIPTVQSPDHCATLTKDRES